MSKAVSLALWVGLLAHAAVGQDNRPTPARNIVYIAPNLTRTMMIFKAGVQVLTLTIPRGTALSVTFDVDKSPNPAHDQRFEFHGNVEIRALVVAQRDPALRLEQAMRQAPITLTATNVDVEIAVEAR